MLVVVTSITVGVAPTSTWLHSTTTNTDKFVDRVAPVVDDPAVEAALGAWAAAELRQVVDLDGFFEEVLPDRGEVLAPVPANAVQGFLAEEATKVFASDTFNEVWETALRRAHEAAIKVLRGGGDNVSVENGKVVLHLTPLLNQVLVNVGDRISGLVGRDIALPTIDPGAPPGEARQKLETALGRPLPDDFGEIEVFDSDQLGAMQVALEYFDRGSCTSPSVRGRTRGPRPVQSRAESGSGERVTKVGVTTADSADDVAWLREHVGLLRVGVLVVAGLLVLFSTLSFIGLLVVGVIVGLIEAWLGLVSRGGTDVTPRAS